MKKYEYSVLNIYSGEYYIMRCNTYYAKGTILQIEYECRECEVHLENGLSVRMY